MNSARCAVFAKVAAFGVGAFALGGCHLFHVKTGCHAAQEYQRAQELPPLHVPSGLDAPNTQGALVIPRVESNAPPRGPNDACLEEPPKYKAAPPSKPLPAT